MAAVPLPPIPQSPGKSETKHQITLTFPLDSSQGLMLVLLLSRRILEPVSVERAKRVLMSSLRLLRTMTLSWGLTFPASQKSAWGLALAVRRKLWSSTENHPRSTTTMTPLPVNTSPSSKPFALAATSSASPSKCPTVFSDLSSPRLAPIPPPASVRRLSPFYFYYFIFFLMILISCVYLSFITAVLAFCYGEGINYYVT